MATDPSLSDVLDAAERAGRLNLRTQEIRESLRGVSAEALRQALYRQHQRGRIVRLSRGSDHWLIVEKWGQSPLVVPTSRRTGRWSNGTVPTSSRRLETGRRSRGRE